MSQLSSKRRVSFVSFAALALLILVALFAVSAQAQPGLAVQAAPASTRDAFTHLEPVGSAPHNGGTIGPGVKFTLDLFLNMGTNAAPNGATAQQSYMTFPSSVLGVVAANGSCTAIPNTTSLAAEGSTFDSVLQNEVCNGPGGCVIRGVSIPAGRIAYASGALQTCPQGCPDSSHTLRDFKVASMTMCSLAGGRGVIHWEFIPEAPDIRDSEIVLFNSDLAHARNLYQDYVINVSGATATPGPPTWTPGVEPAPTGGTQCAMNFTDVQPSNEFYQYIQQLYCRDSNPRIITGFADGTFRPYDNTKRAQLAKLIVLAFRIPNNPTGGPHFTDVAQGTEAYKYIETAYNSGIITGYANHLFKPWDLVKRGQVAKMVVKAGNMTINKAGGPHFTDVPATNEFYDYVETAFNKNIITGFADHTFRPYAVATRGQISKIIAGAMPR